jgi:beta-galactosidase
LDALPKITDRFNHSRDPLTFERFGQKFGFVLYRNTLKKKGLLDLTTVHDRAYVMLDKKLVSIQQKGAEKVIEIGPGVLDILVENQGRGSFGRDPSFITWKGLINGVKFEGAPLLEWDHYGVGQATNIWTIPWSSQYDTSGPTFFKSDFVIDDEPEDTFFNPLGWGKGNVFINGHHIQRYWTIGPQLTVYIPKFYLHKGYNSVAILELENPSQKGTILLDDIPVLDYHPN